VISSKRKLGSILRTGVCDSSGVSGLVSAFYWKREFLVTRNV